MRQLIASVLLLVFTLPCFGGLTEGLSLPEARKLHEFKKHNLGLMDLSSDGRLLLMHQKLRPRDRVKGTGNHRLRVIEASSLKEKAVIELESAQPYMLFRPGSHEVLLNGELKEPAEVGCFLWDVDSGTVHKDATLTRANLSFVQFVGHDQLLGLSPASADSASRHFVLYDFRQTSLTRFEVTAEERQFLKWDGLSFSPDFRTLIGQRYSKPTILTLRELGKPSSGREVEMSHGYPARCVYSPDGRFLIIVSNATGKDSRPIRLGESYLNVYDAKTLELKKSQQILTRELAESWVLHVGSQMAFSPNGRWLVVGYDRYTEKLLGFISYLQATYAILEFPSLAPVAYAEHPQIRTSYEWADISSAQSGRLRFDTNSSAFYSTAKYTIHWSVPEPRH